MLPELAHQSRLLCSRHSSTRKPNIQDSCVISVGCISGSGRVKSQLVPVQTVKAYEGYSIPTSALDKCEGSNSRSGRFTPGERTPIPIEQGVEWAPHPVWMVSQKSYGPAGIRTPDRPVLSQSLNNLMFFQYARQTNEHFLVYPQVTEPIKC